MKPQVHARKRSSMLLAMLFAFVVVSTMGCTTERVVVREPAQRTVIVKKRPGPDQVYVVTKRPPPPRREARARRPSRRHVWVGGYRSWRGHKDVWVQGRWTVPPRHGGKWVAGHWSKRSGGWVWVAGYWRY